MCLGMQVTHQGLGGVAMIDSLKADVKAELLIAIDSGIPSCSTGQCLHGHVYCRAAPGPISLVLTT